MKVILFAFLSLQHLLKSHESSKDKQQQKPVKHPPAFSF